MLQDAGWEVHKRDAVAFNSGSESPEHKLAKLAAAEVLHDRDYRIDSEVVMSEGEVDVLGYGNPDRVNPIVVECETNLDAETKSDKLHQYYTGEPIQECYVVCIDDIPTDVYAAIEWMKNSL